MRLSSLVYVIKQGFKNIWHNMMFSLASVATMVACIFLFSLFFSVLMNLDSVVKDIEQEVGVTVFFVDGTSEERIKEIGDEISSYDGVVAVDYTSAEEAWQQVQEDYFEGDATLAESFGDDNPLANSSSYTVQIDEIEKQDALVSYIETIPDVSKVNQSTTAVKTLTSFNKLVGYASMVIITILLVVSVFLISNTVTVGINVRKNEIAIMKWIGATDLFVRSPFIVEGMILGFIGALIPLGIFYYAYDKLLAVLVEKFTLLGSLADATVPATELFGILLPAGLVLGVGIGLVGSIITVRKHLKV